VYHHPTLGLLYLAGAIRSAFSEREVDVAYQTGFGSVREHLDAISRYRPDLYATSFKTPMAPLAYATMCAVHKAFPSLPIIAGGAHCTAMPDEVLRHSPANSCFRGEGEKSIVQLISNWGSAGPRFEATAGAVFRDGGSIVHNDPAPFGHDLDAYPRPAWDLVDARRFGGMNYERGRPSLGVVVSRGCPWRCTFCSEPIWKINGRPTYRARSPIAIAEEVQLLYENGVREIRLWCEELNADPVWATETLRAIAALGHYDLYLTCNLRAGRLTPELAEAMAAANLWLAYIGIESASQETLDGLSKGLRLEQVEDALALLVKHGIRTLGYFLLYSAWEEDNRLRFEGVSDAWRTIHYAARLWRRGLLKYSVVSVATPRPASVLWEVAHKHRLFRIPPQQPFYYTAEGLSLPGISRSAVRLSVVGARVLQSAMAVSAGRVKYGVFVRGLRQLGRS
jgi:anaerobic magnesium-protoporphyrin IX monomethyl ester cyclase